MTSLPNGARAAVHRPWSALLLVNAVSMLAAGVVLFVWPGLVPAVAGFRLAPETNFVAYLLGASELGLATLFALGMRATDRSARQLIAWTGLVFHAASGLAGLLVARHLGGVVLANVALRVAMVVLFGYFARPWEPARQATR